MQRRVWIVDDSAVDAARAAKALASRYRVEVFSDGAGVLERLHQDPQAPDVIILDWMMPGVSGVDVCRFIRASGSYGSLGLLILTAQRGKEQIVEALASGANDFLAKPFDEEELTARVGALIRTRELVERAEAAEAVTRSVLWSTPDPLFALDDEQNISFVNHAGEELLRASAEDLVGRSVRTVLPGFSLDVIGKPMRDVEIAGRVFSPSVHVFEDSEQPTTLSLREVTHRRRDELRRLDLYSIVAHDLRSPLNVISLRTERVLSGRDGALPPRMLENVRKIDENVRALVGMINDFLDLASLEGQGLNREPVRLCEVIARVESDFRPLIDGNEITWRVECATDVVVDGDARRLVQVVKNLVGNALKYTPPRGTVEIKVARQSKEEGGAVLVSVRDTGRGIAAGDVPALFQRYSRVGANQDVVSGSGLGLMIVREIVQSHGGAVGVESTLGTGSRFWFTLPAARLPATASPHVSPRDRA